VPGSAGVTKGVYMCRNIKQLRNAEVPATEEEIREAALQFVRKVSGYRKPSKRNEAVFEKAIEEISLATQKLLEDLTIKMVN
jgi:hypothetical protein